jgi:hypothetical protein
MTVEDGASIGMSPAAATALNASIQANNEIISESHSSRYDATNNRRYVEIYVRKKFGRNKEHEIEHRQIYDGQTDNLLAFAQTQNGKKVFDRQHSKPIGTNGWDDANAYIDEMMLDRRR